MSAPAKAKSFPIQRGPERDARISSFLFFNFVCFSVVTSLFANPKSRGSGSTLSFLEALLYFPVRDGANVRGMFRALLSVRTAKTSH